MILDDIMILDAYMAWHLCLVSLIPVKVPQIVKIVRAKSGRGISLISCSLELAAVTSTMAYGFAKSYPFR